MSDSTPSFKLRNLGRRIVRFPLTRIILALLFVGVATIIRDVLVALSGLKSDTMAREWLSMILLVLAVHLSYLLYVKLIEKREAVELALNKAVKELALGALVSIGLVCVICGLLWALGYYRVDGINHVSVLAPVFIGAVIAGYVEELAVRGIFFRIIEESLGTWLALVISALAFGFLHLGNSNATVVSSLAIALTAGVMLAATFVLTRRLWMAIGMHWAWNFTHGGIFGVTVSGDAREGLLQGQFSGPELLTGGAFGPESSIVTVVFGLGLGVFLLYWAHRRDRFVSPFWSASRGAGRGR